ncbi:flagellar biosynthetic protein FliO [Sphingobium aromaticiconvertens]|uniref:flagellar biosynthetic protein FliO n=1 Tax=Sphingobium aromaticiconvertens TaxID=365341 RepID=UPI003018376B
MNIGAFLASLFAIIVALGVVLGLAWLSLRLFRQWQDRTQGGEEGERPIRFLRALAVGQRERVTLIEVRGEVMLVGVTSGGISLLARWPQGDTPPPGSLHS